MKITIKSKEIELKYTIRSIIIFEKIANKPFETKTVTDVYLFLYSTILASDPTVSLTFDELITMCDEDDTIINNFNKLLVDTYNRQNIFNDETADTQTHTEQAKKKE